MQHQQLGTLAYTKSPKTSTRTTFQDELQAAVSARANRVVMDQYSSNDFEDEDDFLNELLKSRKKKTETLKKRDALEDMTPLVPDTCEDNAVNAAPRKELPTPKPRQRALTRTNQAQINELCSTTSEPSNQHTTSRCSPNLSEGVQEAQNNRSHSLSSMGEHSMLTKSTLDSESKNGFTSEDIDNNCLSLEELTVSQPQTTLDEPVDLTDCATKNSVPVSENLHDTLVSASRTKGCGSVRTVQSKYLGSLRVLDRTISLHEAQESQEPDSLRAAVYQEWIRKKKESLKQSMEMKKKEFSVKEKQKKDQEAKKEEAKVSYEAWKESKRESLKEKHKEQQERIRKEQRAREEKEEKRRTSKQVFDQWKRERDILLKEKHQRKTKEETDQELQKQEKEKDRRKANYSAFTEWNEKKKNLLYERAIEKRKELNNTVRTERSLKEEKDKLALDMYESWLAKKTIEYERHKEESWFQGILNDGTTPPPWSPPNKTIPRGK
uniref:Microtubule-associated protein 9 n=1 Tax=Knipowitschia caucasica TaxID=637954 RepID=A0AAV2LHG2_KNICA